MGILWKRIKWDKIKTWELCEREGKERNREGKDKDEGKRE